MRLSIKTYALDEQPGSTLECEAPATTEQRQPQKSSRNVMTAQPPPPWEQPQVRLVHIQPAPDVGTAIRRAPTPLIKARIKLPSQLHSLGALRTLPISNVRLSNSGNSHIRRVQYAQFEGHQ